jgi:hypothetical protein
MPWVMLSAASATGGTRGQLHCHTSGGVACFALSQTATANSQAYLSTAANAQTYYGWINVPTNQLQQSQFQLRQAALLQQAQNAMNQQQLAGDPNVRQETPRVDQAAQARALELLMMHLDEHQRKTFERQGLFVVRGGDTGQKYQLHGSTMTGNIHVLGPRDRVTHRLCAHCSHDIPMGDQLLAQKLMLEYDEGYFLGIANRQAA